MLSHAQNVKAVAEQFVAGVTLVIGVLKVTYYTFAQERKEGKEDA